MEDLIEETAALLRAHGCEAAAALVEGGGRGSTALGVACSPIASGGLAIAIWATTPQADALAEEVARGFLYPSFAARKITPLHEGLEALIDRSGATGRRVWLNAPEYCRHNALMALSMLILSVAQRRTPRRRTATPLDQTLRALEVAVTDGRSDEARDLIMTLRSEADLSAADEAFLDCRLKSAARDYEGVLATAASARFGSLTLVPRGVRRDIADALYELYVRGAADDASAARAVRDCSPAITGALRRPQAHSTETERIVWGLLPGDEGDALELPSAAQVPDEVGQAAAGTPNWLDWLEAFVESSTAPEGADETQGQPVLDDAIASWPLCTTAAEGAEARLIGALGDLTGTAEVAVAALAMLRRSQDQPGAITSPAFRAALAKAMLLTPSNAGTNRPHANDAIDLALEGGLDEQIESAVFDAALDHWRRNAGLATLAWATDLLQIAFERGRAQAPAIQTMASEVLAFAHTQARQAHSKMRAHQLEEVLQVCRSVGIDAHDFARADTSIGTVDLSHFRGKQILIYSLDEGVGVYARDRLQEASGAIVSVSSAEVCSPALKTQVKAADLIVVVARRAKHAATDCIVRHATDGTVRWARGTGWSSIVAAVAG